MNKEQFNESILPITTLLGVLGGFFTVFSILYVLIISFCKEEYLRIILLVSEGALALISMFIILFCMAYKNYKKYIKENSLNICKKCLECANSNIKDGFHNHGLLSLKELIAYEGSLAKDPKPSECEVLVYTSDLATEIDAEKAVNDNRDAKVNYKVLFFKNSCNDDGYREIGKLYGEENLLDLSGIEEYKDSFDGKLANTLGFDIMIYKKTNSQSGNMELKGYFAVDFVPADNLPSGNNGNVRIDHIPDCKNPCNYGSKNHEPFYKEISSEKAQILYCEIKKLYEK